jgi:hypothetical protein
MHAVRKMSHKTKSALLMRVERLFSHLRPASRRVYVKWVKGATIDFYSFFWWQQQQKQRPMIYDECPASGFNWRRASLMVV